MCQINVKCNRLELQKILIIVKTMNNYFVDIQIDKY